MYDGTPAKGSRLSSWPHSDEKHNTALRVALVEETGGARTPPTGVVEDDTSFKTPRSAVSSGKFEPLSVYSSVSATPSPPHRRFISAPPINPASPRAPLIVLASIAVLTAAADPLRARQPQIA